MVSMSGLSDSDSRVGWEKLYHWFRVSLPPSGEPMLMLLAAPLAVWIWKKSRPVALSLFLPLGLLLLSDWDSRLGADRLMPPEIYAAQQDGFWGSSPFNRLVPLGAEIYWPDGLELGWPWGVRAISHCISRQVWRFLKRRHAKYIGAIWRSSLWVGVTRTSSCWPLRKSRC